MSKRNGETVDVFELIRNWDYFQSLRGTPIPTLNLIQDKANTENKEGGKEGNKFKLKGGCNALK